MPFDIYSWEDISQNYRDTILLGNGASIAVSQRFGYASLLQHAFDRGLLLGDVRQLFGFFQTDDFELVLRLVWQASNVNMALQIPDQRTHQAYLRVREGLIRAVRDIHPEYGDISNQLSSIYSFLKGFRTTISLNYDLIVYWAMTFGLNINDQHSFKDCFVHGHFDESWRKFREQVGFHDRTTTLVFYPHGSLILCRNAVEQELKINAQYLGLLGSILDLWQGELVIPLFVSEGTEAQKLSSIQNSYYLSTIYREVLPSPKDTLVVYGWGFGEHDLHILRRMRDAGVASVAISVFKNDQAYCYRSFQIIRETLGPHVHIDFFDCESDGCWNRGT